MFDFILAMLLKLCDNKITKFLCTTMSEIQANFSESEIDVVYH